MPIRSQFGRMHLAIIILAVIYALVLSLGLNSMPMHWDEVNHLNGGLLLVRGELWQYALLNSFYPPAFNLVIAAFFTCAGASVLVGRMAAITFSALALLVVFQTAKDMYGKKTAWLSALFFAVMPGIVALSRMAMIETMLIFFFSLFILFLFRWLKENNERDKILSITAFAIGVAVKYQTLVVAPIIMIASLLILGKGTYTKTKINQFIHSRKSFFALLVAAFSIAFALIELYISGLLTTWIYAIQVGNPAQSLYSNRFPMPVFYLIEMTWPYNDTHPISPMLYALSLAGVALLAYTRKPQDKFLLIWLITTYAVFTLIPNRQWRYITLLFPALAISTAALLTEASGKAQGILKTTKHIKSKKALSKIAASLLVIFTATAVFLSAADAYSWATRNNNSVPINQATTYISNTLNAKGSVAVLCPQNTLNNDMIWFYLNSKNPTQTQVWQYPALPIDTFTPKFNVTELISSCQQNNTKILILYEGQENKTYFNSTLTEQTVFNILESTGKFSLNATFGTKPNRILIINFK